MSKTASLILIALSLGIYFTFTMPQKSSLKDLSAKAAEYRNVLENVSRIMETRDNLLTILETIPKADKDRLAKVLPSTADAVGFSRDLDAIASQYGITVRSVALESGIDSESRLIVLPEARKPYDKTIFSISFISNYPNFIKFLSDLERNLRVMDVKSVAFKTSETGLYEHQVAIETYNLRKFSPQAATAVGADLLEISNKLSQASLDKEIFGNSSFRNLSDFSSAIPLQPIGRANPFDPIGRE